MFLGKQEKNLLKVPTGKNVQVGHTRVSPCSTSTNPRGQRVKEQWVKLKQHLLFSIPLSRLSTKSTNGPPSTWLLLLVSNLLHQPLKDLKPSSASPEALPQTEEENGPIILKNLSNATVNRDPRPLSSDQ